MILYAYIAFLFCLFYLAIYQGIKQNRIIIEYQIQILNDQQEKMKKETNNG